MPEDDPTRESGHARSESTPDSLPTVVLIGRYRAGDEEAWRVLYARYEKRVLCAVRARIPRSVRQQFASMDVFQSAFYEACRGLDRFEGTSEGQFLHWISGIVRNKIKRKLEYLHSKKRDVGREALRLDGGLDGSLALPGSDPTPSVVAAQGEEFERLLFGLEQLTDEQRNVIVMKHVQGMTWREISKHLGKAESTLQDIERKARARMTRFIGKGSQPD